MPKRVRPNSKQSTGGPNGSKKGSKSKQGGQKPKKGSSKRSRPSQYRQFDQGTAFLRDHVVRGLANQLISHRKENGGAVQRGFLKGLIDSANDVNSQLEITRNDINNEVSRITAAAAKREASTSSLIEGSNDADGELISIPASSNSGQSVQVAPHVAQRVTVSRREASPESPADDNALQVLAAAAVRRSPARERSAPVSSNQRQ